MINKINYLFVTFFGIGKAKALPGTFGSLATTILLFFLFQVLNTPSNIILFAIIIIFLISFYAVNIYIKDLSNKDPKEVVQKDFNDALKFYLIIFILFRFFDIVKPFPVNYFNKNFKNSFGVIIDDVCAGFYVVLVLILYMVFT